MNGIVKIIASGGAVGSRDNFTVTNRVIVSGATSESNIALQASQYEGTTLVDGGNISTAVASAGGGGSEYWR